MKLPKKTVFEGLPPEYPHSLLSEIRQMVKTSRRKVVVLDDDPTGTQTVRNVTVLTNWQIPALVQALSEDDDVVYILTNSRSFLPPDVEKLNREIASHLKEASSKTGRPFVVVSRSDSTLRGHFPLETDVLMAELGGSFDGVLVIPFFEEGGRFTIGDIHYVAEGEFLVPAAETEYAKDATFGYQSSDLKQWVAEKSGGRIAPSQVASVSLEVIRQGGSEAVSEQLCRLKNAQVCIVNAASYRDLEVFVAGLLRAEKAAKRFLYRTAASFVRVRGGMEAFPLLTAADFDLRDTRNGGLIVAGSYIRKSSEQIAAVQALLDVVSLEVSVPNLLVEEGRRGEIARVVEQADQVLRSGKEALIYTSRQLITGSDAASSLQIGQAVSQSLVEIVRGLSVQPAWVIAKGGITSSDVATKGLGITQARVLGQVLPGVPVWQAGTGSRWPGMVYVVFPGNVGGPQSIAEVVKMLSGRT
ncbi:MAG: four-carbon acid sugar kinase family protein [Anaerolineales bacterium]